MSEEVIEETEYELLDTSTAISASDRASIDSQIATAKAYPRVISKSLETIHELACKDKETAEQMYYTLPRAKKQIQGPSVRFSEIITYSWGNLRVDSQIISIDETSLTGRATCLDLERNIAHRCEVKMRIVDKYGKRYNEDMIIMTANAACSKASRNAVFKVVPFSLVKDCYEKALKTSLGKEEPFEIKVAKEFERWATIKVTPAQLLKKLGRRSEKDLTIEDMISLIGFRTAMKEGASLDDIFGEESEGGTDELNKKLEAKRKAKEAEIEKEVNAGLQKQVQELNKTEAE